MIYRDSLGATLTLGKKLGEGGEGAVFVTREQPDMVAKVYVKPPPLLQFAKLDAMVRAGDPALRDVAAWPSALLYDGAQPVGFTMPRLAARHPLHELLGPKRRQVLFPAAHWTFLIHTAVNVARTFEVLHARGIVIGDVNSNNVVVHRDSTAQLIDCDSFQIPGDARIFRCNVGVAEYQPPELQGHDLSAIDRTPEHDRFGLAVMIFQLLFVGKHPFAGVLPAHAGENGAIGANVAAKRFFYGGEARRRGLRPPPGSLALAALTPPVVTLFAQAFLGEPHERPSAAAWRRGLEDLERATVACRAGKLHRHVAGKGCPWCALERRGLHYFAVPGAKRAMAPLDNRFWTTIGNDEVERAWNAVAAVAAPPAATATIEPQRRYRAAPLRLWTTQHRRAYVAGALGVTAAIALVATFAPGWRAVCPGIAALALWVGLAFRPDARLAAAVRERRATDTRRAYAAAREAWLRSARGTSFVEKRNEFARLRAQLAGQRARYDAEVARLHAEHELRALEAFLRSQTVRAFRHPALDSEMRGMLDGYGITSAADVSWERLPGPRLWGRVNYVRDTMIDWRIQLERRFAAQPRPKLDPATLRALTARHARERTNGYAALTAGADVLRAITAAVIADRARLEARARRLAEEAWQAEADAKISPLCYRTPLL